MSKMVERTNPALRGLRVFVQFSKEELQKRRYLLPPATVIKTYQAEESKSDSVLHVLELDGEESFTAKDEPLGGKPRHFRSWILTLSTRGALERLTESSVKPERIEVTLFVKRDNCFPYAETLDTTSDLLEICSGVIALMPEEKRGQTIKVPETNLRGRLLTVAVDENEWQDLAGKVELNTILEIQLSTWTRAAPTYWSSRSPKRKTEHLGMGLQGSADDRKLVQLRRNSNLYYFAGPARRVTSKKYFDPQRQKERERREALLDCGLPVVFEDIISQGELSNFVEKQGELMMGLCFLFGSISFSGTQFRTPLVARVVGITQMDLVPHFVLLDVELLPQSTKPEVRVTYHSEEKEPLVGVELSGYVLPKVP